MRVFVRVGVAAGGPVVWGMGDSAGQTGRACCGWSSPVRGGMSIASRFAARTMPSLWGWTFVLSGFCKHAIPTGLDTSFGHWFYKHAAPDGADADSETTCRQSRPIRRAAAILFGICIDSVHGTMIGTAEVCCALSRQCWWPFV